MFVARLAVALFATTSTAFAQAPARPLWEYGVSALATQQPAYVGSDKTTGRALVLPWFIYRGDVFRADGNTAGARLLKNDQVEFDLGFAAAFGASSDDVTARKGMPSLGFQFEFGPRVKYRIAQLDAHTRLGIDVPLRAAFESNSGIQHRGWVSEPRIELERRMTGFRLQGTASVALADQRYGHFVYGVPTAFATPTRPAYVGKAGLVSARLQGTVFKQFSPDWGGFMFVRQDSSGGSANAASPLFKQSSGTSVGAGLIWTIGRSAALAKD